MKRYALLIGCVVACKSDPPASPYSHDIEKLCNVAVLAGAEGGDPVGRMVTTANWLAANLETAESRTFLVKLQALEGAAKGDALDAEARSLGITSCPLSAEWRK